MGVFTAMIALGLNPRLLSAKIQQELKADWPELSDLVEIEGKLGLPSFRTAKSQIHLGHLPAPILWSELAGPCATSFLWQDAEKDLRPHSTHLLVVVSGESTKLQQAKLATQVTAGVLATCPAAIGVYWGAASLVIPAKIFCDFATQVMPFEPPIQILGI
jgi:hypothetical protein